MSCATQLWLKKIGYQLITLGTHKYAGRIKLPFLTYNDGHKSSEKFTFLLFSQSTRR